MSITNSWNGQSLTLGFLIKNQTWSLCWSVIIVSFHTSSPTKFYEPFSFWCAPKKMLSPIVLPCILDMTYKQGQEILKVFKTPSIRERSESPDTVPYSLQLRGRGQAVLRSIISHFRFSPCIYIYSSFFFTVLSFPYALIQYIILNINDLFLCKYLIQDAYYIVSALL